MLRNSDVRNAPTRFARRPRAAPRPASFPRARHGETASLERSPDWHTVFRVLGRDRVRSSHRHRFDFELRFVFTQIFSRIGWSHSP
jgi:hypothetical protein